jgi:high affinity Mn2+ porin
MRAGVAAAALLVTGGAGAADLSVPAASPVYDWSGFYVGGHLGFATAGSEFTGTQSGRAPNLTGTLDLFRPYDSYTGEGSNFAGFQGGYNILYSSATTPLERSEAPSKSSCRDGTAGP